MNILIVKRQQDLIKSFIKDKRLDGEIIELGCGDGSNLESLSHINLKGYGYDVSEKALDIAREKKIKSFTTARGDLLNLNISGKNSILLLLTLEHLPNDALAIRKINSYLKKDGWLILSIPAHSDKYSYQDRISGHLRRYDRNHILSLLNESGFCVKKIVSFGFPLNNIITTCYNFYLSITGPVNDVCAKNTYLTGMAGYRGHFPGRLIQISYLLFPALAILRKLDAPFLNTDFGTHYLVFAQKDTDNINVTGR